MYIILKQCFINFETIFYFIHVFLMFFYSLTVSMCCKTLIHFDNTHKDWRWGHGGVCFFVFFYHKTSKQYMFVCTSATVCVCVSVFENACMCMLCLKQGRDKGRKTMAKKGAKRVEKTVHTVNTSGA